MRACRVLETCLYVDDLGRAEAFYRDVLGLTVLARAPERHVFFRCEGAVFLLFDPDATAEADGDIPPHGARGPGHVAFAAAEDALPRWRAHLQAAGVEIEAEVAWPQGGRSLYFRDPDGNSIELASPRIWGLAA